MSSGEVIEVDFETGRVVKTTGAYVKYDWSCSMCGESYTFDDREQDRTMRVDIPSHDGKKTRSICEHCVNLMKEAIDGTGGNDE